MVISDKKMKKLLEQKKIDDFPFKKSLLKRSLRLYMTKGGKPRRKLNAKDSYQREILEVCLRISALIEQLRLSRTFIEDREKCTCNENLSISNSDYIRYHLECYYIRITTYKDLMLKLCNRVCKYEITEGNGLEKNLKKRLELENNQIVSELLVGLDILMDKIKPIRNNLAHGGYHEDVDLILIESKDLYRDIQKEDNEYDKILHRLINNSTLNMYMIDYMMVTLIELFFKKLYPIRKIKEKEL